MNASRFGSLRGICPCRGLYVVLPVGARGLSRSGARGPSRRGSIDHISFHACCIRPGCTNTQRTRHVQVAGCCKGVGWGSNDRSRRDKLLIYRYSRRGFKSKKNSIMDIIIEYTMVAICTTSVQLNIVNPRGGGRTNSKPICF